MAAESRRCPLVTVAMPVYNAGLDLLPALRSVVNQTYDNWELLLIDDGSTDEAVAKACEAVADPRIHVIRDGRNLGLTARLNQAIGLARGELLARMDQDDVCYPERFEQQVALLQREPALDLVAVRALVISPEGDALGYFPYRLAHEEIVAHPWNGFYFPHPTWMGRIEWFQRHRYATYHCEDQGLLLRTYAVSCFATVPEVLFAYRRRRTFNWSKTMFVRRALLKLQLAEFLPKGQFFMCFMALLAFVVKGGRDVIVSVLLRRVHAIQRSVSKLPPFEVARWKEVAQQVGGSRQDVQEGGHVK